MYLMQMLAHFGTLFKHTGMCLKLFPNEDANVEIFFPMVRTGWYNSLYAEFVCRWDQSVFTNLTWNVVDTTWHSLSEYNRRLGIQKRNLEKMELNDLYSRHDIVGRLIAEF
jgi:hypothetical protein